MTNIELKKKVDELGPWYQKIRFNDEVESKSSHSKWSGEYAWSYTRRMLPKSLEGLRILDLGCNAGLFSARCAQLGAEVVGIDNDRKAMEQARFVVDYFEQKDKVTLIEHDLEKIFDLNLGNFDYVLAISVLYWIGRNNPKPKKGSHYNKCYRDRELAFIEKLVKMTDNIIVRTRNGKWNNAAYYRNVFEDHGFEMELQIDELDNLRQNIKMVKK